MDYHHLTEFFESLYQRIKTFGQSLLTALVNYIRSKTRDLPSHIPAGKGETLHSLWANTRFQEFITAYARETGFAVAQVEENARRYFDEIAADMNYLAFPFWDFLITWALNTIYEGIVVDTEALDRLQPLFGKKPIVFVPNHRSHMDYMLLSYVTYYHRIPMPHIVGGLNLSFWPFGPFARKSGCFFIRRSFEGNKLYAACIRFYIQEHLRRNNPMEFFIEGTRTRTGKLLPPRMGILSSIVDAFYQGVSEDVLFVPTSFTYESVLEEKTYLAEQSGSVKKEESIWDILRISKYLKKRQGKVYIRFGEPLSLQDCLKGTKAEEKRVKVEELAHQLTYGINKSSLVTPISLTSMALLSHPRKMISRQELSLKVQTYLDYLRFKECPLSEPLKKFEVSAFHESLRQFKTQGFLEEYEDEGEILYHILEPKRGQLDYYKNISIHFFVSLAVLCRICNSIPTDVIPRHQLAEDYRFLQQLFCYEFTFSTRQSLPEHLEKLLNYLQQKQAIQVSDTEVKILRSGPLKTFASLLQNFFESYWLVWRTLPLLGNSRWEQRELLKYLTHKGEILLLREEIKLPEANFKFNLQNALQSYLSLGFLKVDTEGWDKKRKTYYELISPDNKSDETVQRIERLLAARMVKSPPTPLFSTTAIG